MFDTMQKFKKPVNRLFKVFLRMPFAVHDKSSKRGPDEVPEVQIVVPEVHMLGRAFQLVDGGLQLGGIGVATAVIIFGPENVE